MNGSFVGPSAGPQHLANHIDCQNASLSYREIENIQFSTSHLHHNGFTTNTKVHVVFFVIEIVGSSRFQSKNKKHAIFSGKRLQKRGGWFYHLHACKRRTSITLSWNCKKVLSQTFINSSSMEAASLSKQYVHKVRNSRY